MSRLQYSSILAASMLFCHAACLPQPSGVPADPDVTSDMSADMMVSRDMSGEDLDAAPSLDMEEDANMMVPDLSMPEDMAPAQDMPDDEPDQDVVVDMPPPGPRGVPVLVGTGDFGRRIISCDGGSSWQETGTFLGGSQYCMDGEDIPVCYAGDNTSCSFLTRDGMCRKSSQCDCDHSPGSSLGVTFAGDEDGGAFIGVFGWGNVPTTFVRSEDGITWTEAEGVVNTPAGVAYGGGVAMLGTKKGWHSDDEGLSWQEGGSFDIVDATTGENVFNTRQVMYVPTAGGRFIVTASSGKTRDDGTRYEVYGVALTDDAGATWFQPNAPNECGYRISGILGDETRIVMLHGDGLSCVSTDGGQTFTAHQVDVDSDTFGSVQGTPLYDGEKFWIWARDRAYTSQDGVTWQRQDRGDSFTLGVTAYDPHHERFVSVRGGWKQWYDKQEFYWSSDGITWEKAADGSYTPGHRIRRMTFGWAKEGTVCPTP